MGLCGGPFQMQPTPHSPLQRQLAQALHPACSEHVLLRARPIQYRTEAECYVGASTRGPHLEWGWHTCGHCAGPGIREGGAL